MKKRLVLAKREKEIMDVLYRLGRASVAEVRGHLSKAPSYSAVRATLRILEEKGHARHEFDPPRYVYLPTVGRRNASLSALEHLVDTFFDGSTEKVVAALMETQGEELSEASLRRIQSLIDEARKEGR